MKRFKENKYYGLSVSLLIVGVVLIVFYHTLVHFTGFTSIINTVQNILAPFIYGLVMAYLLCPIYNLTVRKTYPLTCKMVKNKKRAFGISKIIGSTISVICLLGVIAGFLALLVPQLIDSVVGLVRAMPERFASLSQWVNDISKDIDNPTLSRIFQDFVNNGQRKMLSWAENTFLPSLGEYMNMVSQGVLATLKAMLNLLIGIVVAVYFLNGKETFKAHSQKIILALASEKRAKGIFDFATFSNKTFGGFINGKIIDSIIIGILCFIAMSVLNLPYPILVSTIVGVTNVIPFFGPFIGAIPGTLIVAFVDPIQAIYFMIMVFVLQQLDGNVIGPAILGGSTGLSSFWVMFAIIVGGGLFGFMGMVIGVPVFAIIYYYFGRFINMRLKKKEIINETKYYEDFSRYNIDKKDVRD